MERFQIRRYRGGTQFRKFNSTPALLILFGKTILFIATMPPHVCINELVIAPVWNRIYIGGTEIARK